MTASQGRSGQVVRGPDAAEAERPRAKASDRRSRRAGAPRRPGPRANIAASRPIVPGPEDQQPVAGPQARRPGPRAARCRRARPARPTASSTASGRACSAVTGTASCSASAPGQPPRMPISYRSSQTCWRPPPAAAAAPAAEHGVAGDPAAEPAGSTPGADRATRAAPLVAEPHRVGGVALVQVGHLAGEELHVGAADADPRRRRRRPAPAAGHRRRDLLDLGPPGAGDDEGAHHRRLGRGRSGAACRGRRCPAP